MSLRKLMTLRNPHYSQISASCRADQQRAKLRRNSHWGYNRTKSNSPGLNWKPSLIRQALLSKWYIYIGFEAIVESEEAAKESWGKWTEERQNSSLLRKTNGRKCNNVNEDRDNFEAACNFSLAAIPTMLRVRNCHAFATTFTTVKVSTATAAQKLRATLTIVPKLHSLSQKYPIYGTHAKKHRSMTIWILCWTQVLPCLPAQYFESSSIFSINGFKSEKFAILGLQPRICKSRVPSFVHPDMSAARHISLQKINKSAKGMTDTSCDATFGL